MKKDIKNTDILFEKYAGCRGGKGGCSAFDGVPEWIKCPEYNKLNYDLKSIKQYNILN